MPESDVFSMKIRYETLKHYEPTKKSVPKSLFEDEGADDLSDLGDDTVPESKQEGRRISRFCHQNDLGNFQPVTPS